jgi:valyl-tRNA synthetase
MQFITEEIWSYLPHEEASEDNPDNFLIKGHWPEYSEELTFPAEAEKLEMAMSIIKSIRNIRAEAEESPGKKLTAVILCGEGREDVVKAGERYIKKLANITDITFISDKKDVPEETMSAVVDGAEVYIPLDDLMDYEAEYARLTKEKERLTKEVARVTNQLANEKFVSRAPAHVIQAERDKLAGYQDMLEKTLARIPVVEKKLNK